MNQTRFPKFAYLGLLLLFLLACQTPSIISTNPTPSVVPSLTVNTYSSSIYKLPMSLSFGSDWHVADNYPDLITLKPRQADWNLGFNIVTSAKVADPGSGAQVPFPEDFAAWLKSNPNFKAGDPVEVTVAGIKGTQIDATPAVTEPKDFLYLSGTQWSLVPSPEGWRFILLNDVNGERLLILLKAPADQFTAAAGQAQAILASVSFSK